MSALKNSHLVLNFVTFGFADYITNCNFRFDGKILIYSTRTKKRGQNSVLSVFEVFDYLTAKQTSKAHAEWRERQRFTLDSPESVEVSKTRIQANAFFRKYVRCAYWLRYCFIGTLRFYIFIKAVRGNLNVSTDIRVIHII